MGKSKRDEPVKLTLLVTKRTAAALRKKAKAECTSISALVRRFAVGLAALSLLACGESDFSAQPMGSAGMGASGSGGMSGSGGSTGVGEGHQCNESVACDPGLFCDDDGKCSLQSDTGGACDDGGECVSGRCVESRCAEPVAPYDGPAWVECADGVLTARGFEAMLSEMRIVVAADFWGTEYSLRPSCSIDDEYSVAASAPIWESHVDGTLAIFTSHFDEAVGTREDPNIPIEIQDFTMSKSTTLTCEFQWSAALGSDADPPFGMADLVRCLVSAPGVEVPGTTH